MKIGQESCVSRNREARWWLSCVGEPDVRLRWCLSVNETRWRERKEKAVQRSSCVYTEREEGLSIRDKETRRKTARRGEKGRERKEEKESLGDFLASFGLFKSITMLTVGLLLCPRLSNRWCNDAIQPLSLSPSLPLFSLLAAGAARGERPWIAWQTKRKRRAVHVVSIGRNYRGSRFQRVATLRETIESRRQCDNLHPDSSSSRTPTKELLVLGADPSQSFVGFSLRLANLVRWIFVKSLEETEERSSGKSMTLQIVSELSILVIFAASKTVPDPRTRWNTRIDF